MPTLPTASQLVFIRGVSSPQERGRVADETRDFVCGGDPSHEESGDGKGASGRVLAAPEGLVPVGNRNEEYYSRDAVFCSLATRPPVPTRPAGL